MTPKPMDVGQLLLVMMLTTRHYLKHRLAILKISEWTREEDSLQIKSVWCVWRSIRIVRCRTRRRPPIRKAEASAEPGCRLYKEA